MDKKTEYERSTFFKHLYNRFPTINSPWHPQFDKNNTNRSCPVCNKHKATQAHVRSNCEDTEMKASYTYRHNEAVETIHAHVRKGEKISFYLKSDANKQTITPQARPTIPQQLVNMQQLTPQERRNAKSTGHNSHREHHTPKTHQTP